MFEIACVIEGSRVTEATNRVKGEIGRAKQELRSVTWSGKEVKVLPGTQATFSAQHFSSLQNMPHVVSIRFWCGVQNGYGRCSGST